MSASQVGDLLEGGYRVLEVKHPQPPYLYRVRKGLGSSLEIEELPLHLGRRGRRKLERQRRLLSWVRHPHIRLPLDLCPGPSGLLLVHRRLAGEPLERRLWRLPPTVSEVLRWGQELCALLSHLNQHGLTLGQLSPTNLHLDGDSHLQLVGFRLSPAMDFEPGLPEFGPANFKAPEAIADQRSDVFVAGRLVEYLLAWAPGRAPSEVRQTLERATDPDPTRRYQSCASFQSALRSVRLQAGPRDAPVPRISWLEMARRTGAALLALLLAAGLLWSWNRAERYRNGASWTRPARATAGAVIWISGQLAGVPTLKVPHSGVLALGYRTRTVAVGEREEWDAADEDYRRRPFERVLEDRCWLAQASLDGVPLEDGPVNLVGALRPCPVTAAWPLEVGEKRLGLYCHERVLAPGDPVVIRGVLGLDGIRALEIRPGTRWDWELGRLQAALPGIGLALTALGGLWRLRRQGNRAGPRSRQGGRGDGRLGPARVS
ncbi:MAG: hypothetical protein AMXMBFR33_40260 [Candidatus Xenobia bacterium]